MGASKPAVPPDDKARVATLRSFEVLDTDPEPEFDAIVKLAAEACSAPIALVALIDDHRQWFKARLGLEATQLPRDLAICSYAILGEGTMVVPNAAIDPRFVDNPLRTLPPHVEFYAGVPLRTSGYNVGTLCVMDHVPRKLTAAQRRSLQALADQTVRLLELRRTAILQRDALASLRASDEALREGATGRAAPGDRGSWRWAMLVVALLGVASVLASYWVRLTVEAAGAVRLAHAAERAASFLEARVAAYGEILRGMGALFRASDRVSPAEFEAYVGSLGIQHSYPGLFGLGYAERVPRAQLAQWLDQTRGEGIVLELDSSGDVPELVINKLLDPFARNRPALGFDAATDPARARALAASERSRDLALTERVRLRQDESDGPGFMMYLPVLSQRPNPPAVTGRWVFAALLERNLVSELKRAAGADIIVHIFDDAGGGSILGGTAPEAGSSHRVDVKLADRTFRLEAWPGPGFFSISERTEPWAILILGLGATFLSFALVRALRDTQERSRELAMRMTDALRRGERELRAVIEGTTDLVVTFAADGRLLLTNRAFQKLLGYEASQISSMTMADIVPVDARQAFQDALASVLPDQAAREIDTVFRASSGARIEVQGALSFAMEHGHRVTRAIFRDVTSRRQAERALGSANEALAKANQKLERLAATDGLTGIANRRVFDERLAEELARARRNGTPLALALLDIDHFKLYNDTYGHQQGDACLKRVGACLRTVTRRAGEVAARYGGEEFALILPGSDASAATQVADDARARIASLAIAHDKNTPAVVTASVGVACFDPRQGSDPRQLIAAADRALYNAKRAGRNRVELAA